MPQGPGSALMHSQLTIQKASFREQGALRGQEVENVVRVNQAHQVLEQTLPGG